MALERTVKNTRAFSYVKNDVNLSFTLDPDNFEELRTFAMLLKMAVADVEDILPKEMEVVNEPKPEVSEINEYLKEEILPTEAFSGIDNLPGHGEGQETPGV
jgi:hypothetical protein